MGAKAKKKGASPGPQKKYLINRPDHEKVKARPSPKEWMDQLLPTPCWGEAFYPSVKDGTRHHWTSKRL